MPQYIGCFQKDLRAAAECIQPCIWAITGCVKFLVRKGGKPVAGRDFDDFCVFHAQMMVHRAGTWRDFFQTPFPALGYRYRHIFPRKSDPRPRTAPLSAEKENGHNEDPTPGGMPRALERRLVAAHGN